MGTSGDEGQGRGHKLALAMQSVPRKKKKVVPTSERKTGRKGCVCPHGRGCPALRVAHLSRPTQSRHCSCGRGVAGTCPNCKDDCGWCHTGTDAARHASSSQQMASEMGIDHVVAFRSQRLVVWRERSGVKGRARYERARGSDVHRQPNLTAEMKEDFLEFCKIAASHRQYFDYPEMRMFILLMTNGRWHVGSRAHAHANKVLTIVPADWRTADYPADETIRALCVEMGVAYNKLATVGLKMLRPCIELELKHMGAITSEYLSVDTYCTDEINLPHNATVTHARAPKGEQLGLVTTENKKGPSSSAIVTIGLKEDTESGDESRLTGDLINLTVVHHHPKPTKEGFDCPNENSPSNAKSKKKKGRPGCDCCTTKKAVNGVHNCHVDRHYESDFRKIKKRTRHKRVPLYKTDRLQAHMKPAICRLAYKKYGINMMHMYAGTAIYASELDNSFFAIARKAYNKKMAKASGPRNHKLVERCIREAIQVQILPNGLTDAVPDQFMVAWAPSFCHLLVVSLACDGEKAIVEFTGIDGASSMHMHHVAIQENLHQFPKFSRNVDRILKVTDRKATAKLVPTRFGSSHTFKRH